MKLLTYLNQKPIVNWFKDISEYNSEKEILLLAQQLEYYWRRETLPPNYIDVVMFGIAPQSSFQYKAVIQNLCCVLRGKSSQLLAGTGTGKTYMNFSVLDIMAYFGYFEQLETLESAKYPFKAIYFTPPSVVEQTKEVKVLYKNIHPLCVVINYETLRTKFGLGNIFIEWKTESIQGSIQLTTHWISCTSPPVIVLDENQKLKNNGTMVTKFIQQYNNLKPRRILQMFSSATPFVRPSESKTVVLALSPKIELSDDNNKKKKKVWIKNEEQSTFDKVVHDAREVFIKDTTPIVSLSNYDYFMSEMICHGNSKPDEYSPANMERLTKYLSSEGQLVHVHDVKFKHITKNKHILIDFYDDNEKKVYSKIYEEYVNNLLKINKAEPSGMAKIFVEILKFRKAAEFLRARHLARIAHEQMTSGKSVIIATAFTDTQDVVLNYLLNEYKISPDLITKIRGGQSKKARWDNINKFQDDKAHIMLLMQQAGGVGLSLHNYKPRNKRPRFVLMSPVWSIIEMLQVLGRAHRINSDSTTIQWVIWYRGTIEESVYERLKEKSLSMRELMRKKEQWSDLFVQETNRKHVDLKEIYEDGSNSIINQHSNEDEDEEDNDETPDFFNKDAENIADNMVVEV